MNFEVYCDESGLEALSDHKSHLYTAIGSVWLPAEFRNQLKQAIKAIKDRHNIKGELKWNKVSPAYLFAYEEVIRYFFESEYLRFRVILIEAAKVDALTFHDGDIELGFYKFYYQLLHHWIFDNNSYNIFLDLKVNRDKGRLKALKKFLSESNRTSNVFEVQGLPSEQSPGIQVADILTGLVAAKFREHLTSPAKTRLIALIEEHLEREIAPTSRWEEKFNVFMIEMQGGW